MGQGSVDAPCPILNIALSALFRIGTLAFWASWSAQPSALFSNHLPHFPFYALVFVFMLFVRVSFAHKLRICPKTLNLVHKVGVFEQGYFAHNV